MKKFVIIGIVLILFVFVAKTTFAAQQFSKTICHHTPGNAVTLTFNTVQAYAGHLGQPHSVSTFDTNGACSTSTPTPTLLPTTTPTNVPTATPTPKKSCDTGKACLRDCEPTVTPTEVPSLTPTQEVTPTSTVSATPTEVTPTPTTPPSPHGDGLSDGRESGHVNAPSLPKAPPATGKGR
jgi:hypothetical protein